MTKEDLIKTIHVDPANFDHIAKTGKINGTLLSEIKRVMQEYNNTMGIQFQDALKCDGCGCTPITIYKTNKGMYCEQCNKHTNLL